MESYYLQLHQLKDLRNDGYDPSIRYRALLDNR